MTIILYYQQSAFIFFHFCVKASLARYVSFSVLLSVLTNVFIFYCLSWNLIRFPMIVMFQNVMQEA